MSRRATNKAREDPPDPKKEPEKVTLFPGVVKLLKEESTVAPNHDPEQQADRWQRNNERSMEVLGAYLRMGARELGTALSHHGDSTVHGEYGTLATRPPSMVAEGLRGRSSVHGKDDVDVNMENQQPDPEVEPEIEPDLDLDMDMDMD